MSLKGEVNLKLQKGKMSTVPIEIILKYVSMYSVRQDVVIREVD